MIKTDEAQPVDVVQKSPDNSVNQESELKVDVKIEVKDEDIKPDVKSPSKDSSLQPSGSAVVPPQLDFSLIKPFKEETLQSPQKKKTGSGKRKRRFVYLIYYIPVFFAVPLFSQLVFCLRK